MKYLYKTTLIALFLFGLCSSVFGAEINFKSENINPGIGQDFYVDLVLDTNGASINGIEGSVSFNSDALSFVRSENAKSFITHWIVSPAINSPGVIRFSGIVPNGFTGFFNNTDSNSSNNGTVTRLVFRPIKSGETKISLENSISTLNNGEGTVNEIKKTEYSVNIKNDRNKESYSIYDTNPPELTSEIITDPNLYENKKTLVFNATDKESGVQGVYLKKDGEWILISNPFLLDSQSFQGILTVKAVDLMGNSVTKRFLLPGYSKNTLYIMILALLIFTACAFRFLYKTYAKNKL